MSRAVTRTAGAEGPGDARVDADRGGARFGPPTDGGVWRFTKDVEGVSVRRRGQRRQRGGR